MVACRPPRHTPPFLTPCPQDAANPSSDPDSDSDSDFSEAVGESSSDDEAVHSPQAEVKAGDELPVLCVVEEP